MANDLVTGVCWPAEQPLRWKGFDMIRVPRPSDRHTAPRRGASLCMRIGWSVGGVQALSAGTPSAPRAEGAGMT